MKVGFVLENGFNSDDGALKTTNKLFDPAKPTSL